MLNAVLTSSHVDREPSFFSNDMQKTAKYDSTRWYNRVRMKGMRSMQRHEKYYKQYKESKMNEDESNERIDQ